MALDLESAYAALFARLQQAATPEGSTFVTSTRILQDWDNSPPPKCPALMLTSGHLAQDTKDAALPATWIVTPNVVIYCRNTTAPPSIQLNQLIAAVVGLLQTQAGETQGGVPPGGKFVVRPPGQYATTLGGLAAYVRVGGPIEVWEGLIGGTGAAAACRIPIEMKLSS